MEDNTDKDRSLSEDFQSRSPNTQMYVRFYTDGKTPSSKLKKAVSYNNLSNYGDVSAEVRDILIQYGLVTDNRNRYTRNVAGAAAVVGSAVGSVSGAAVGSVSGAAAVGSTAAHAGERWSMCVGDAVAGGNRGRDRVAHSTNRSTNSQPDITDL
jgi:hypothetical protein